MRVCAFISLFFAVATAEGEGEVSFNRDIRPFLSDTCFQCHGPDSETREADLRLDVAESAMADLGGYAAIVPGDPDESEAVYRIFAGDADELMPPPDSGLTLTPEQKELFRKWVADGAKFERHWSFAPIERPALPGGTGELDPVDRFVRARLADAGMEPAPAAGPEIQLRRVSLDLTGLSPSAGEVDAFLDDCSRRGVDMAYEAAVDRLLASPRFGERMAWQWLEAARYADTDGYQNDGPREMWRWRDWVIDAYNSGMRFDQFTIEQLAGDLLPEPAHEQLLATAFNRNNRYNSESGIPLDEFLLENAVDRVDTTSAVWMGLTMGCARCHDHKYDPFSQEEYYALIDYFNDVAESGRAIKFGNSEPWIRTPTIAQRDKLETLRERVRKTRAALEEAGPSFAEKQGAWERGFEQEKPVLSHGLDHFFSFDEEDERVVAEQGAPVRRDGFRGKAATVGGKGSFVVGKIPGLICNGRFSVAFWMNPGEVSAGAVLSNEAPDTKRSGIFLEFRDGHLRWNINSRWIAGVATIETRRTFRPGEWVHVVLTNDGTQRAGGMTIHIDGEEQEVAVIRNTNSNTMRRAHGTPMRIGHSKHVGFWKGQVDELRFYPSRTLSAGEARLLAVRETPGEIAAIPAGERSAAQAELMRLAFMEQGDAGRLAKMLAALQKAEGELVKFRDSLPTTMVMKDLAEPRPSHVRARGVYDQTGERVAPGVPGVFPPLPDPGNSTRLDFAKWLVSGEHPLTARVTVNRYWQMLFGRGLVNTAEDFGSQGELPTHPQLLDWLSAEFMASGWDIKGILKTIVTSRTYRQSSAVRRGHLERDPDNLLLARAPRPRLQGNVLRDQALLASGLLVERRGGPSVRPYQPANLWREASNFSYKPGKGDDLYRRSLYTYWKRTLAPPTMAVLDTADREYCSVKPKRTNTPLQALTLMNDVTFVEAARKLGERMLTEGGDGDAERVTFAFRTVAARFPEKRELDLLVRALDEYRAEFRGDPKRARTVLQAGESPVSDAHSAGEQAAAMALANVLLNLEEVTTRE